MKTIAQIAAEIGVSKQAVHKKIKQEPLSTSLQEFTTTTGNTIYISVDGEALIKQAFNQNIVNRVDEVDGNQRQPIDNQSSTNDNQVDDSTAQLNSVKHAENNEEILFLREQNKALLEELEREREHNRAALEREREHSRQQANRIADLADSLAELTRNTQILLKQEQDKTPVLLPSGEPPPAEPADQQAERETEPTTEPPRGFFKRIFGTKK